MSNGVTISRHEYITDIYGDTGFDNRNYHINPGNSLLFKFASQVARNFEQYKFKSLVFMYRSCSTGSTINTLQLGTVNSVCSYNSMLPTLKNKVEMLEHAGCVSSKICNGSVFPIEVNPAKNALGPIMYVTSASCPNALVTNTNNTESGNVLEDPKTYFLGNFQIAVNNCAAETQGKTIGELWVAYELVLMRPRLYTALNLGNPFVALKMNLPANIAYGGNFGLATQTNNAFGLAGGDGSTVVIIDKLSSARDKSSTYGEQLCAGLTNDGVISTQNATFGNGVDQYNYCYDSGGFWSEPGSLTNYRLPDNLSDGYYEMQVAIIVPPGKNLNPNTKPDYLYKRLAEPTCSSNITVIRNSGFGARTVVDCSFALSFAATAIAGVTSRTAVFGCYFVVNNDAFSFNGDGVDPNGTAVPIATGTYIKLNDALALAGTPTSVNTANPPVTTVGTAIDPLFNVVVSLKRIQPFTTNFII